MIVNSDSRVAITMLLFSFQLSLFLSELAVLEPSIGQRYWYNIWRQWVGPFGVTAFGFVVVALTYNDLATHIGLERSSCGTGVDAEIAGLGVRIAAFAQVGTLIVVSVLGSFHPRATGAKELGAGLMLTSVSLAIALLVGLSQKSLNLAEAALGAMILDGQSMALSIQLTSKETLAARWQTACAVLTQLFGLAIVTVIIAKYRHGYFVQDSCECLGIFWWGWLNPCHKGNQANESAIGWIYITCRYCCVLQTTLHGLWNMKAFDEAEKDGRNTDDEQRKLGGTLIKTTHPRSTGHGSARFGEYPATVTFMYAFYGLLSITSLATAEITLHDLNLSPTSGVNSIGQVIALVIAAATVLRALFLFGCLFSNEKAEAYGLVWPFKIGHVPSIKQPLFIIPTRSDHPASELPIGAVLRSPFDLDSGFSQSIGILEHQIKVRRYDGLKDQTNKSSSGRKLFWIAYSVHDFVSRKAPKLQVEELALQDSQQIRLIQEALTEYAKLDDVVSSYGSGTGRATVYLVVKREVITGSGEKNTRVKRFRAKFEKIFRIVGMDREAHGRPTIGNVEGAQNQWIDSYSVVEVTLSKDGPGKLR